MNNLFLLAICLASCCGAQNRNLVDQRLSKFLTRACQNSCKNGLCKEVVKPAGEPFEVKCYCLPGYKGYYCHKPDCNPPCQQGNCIAQGNRHVCICKKGFSGPACGDVNWNLVLGLTEVPKVATDQMHKVTIRADPRQPACAVNFVCQNAGQCIRKGNTVRCECVKPYIGTFCQVRCAKQCQNNGHCYLDRGEERCICSWGYNGIHCEKRILSRKSRAIAKYIPERLLS
ncbi:hypothetical protein SNE40_004437 [Patella caerulea]|uniref:EGF-like domain-containing protein n=1 Tax=Patella caerulea TaxID=87958 RepID=A0AAN8K4R0_PATCE